MVIFHSYVSLPEGILKENAISGCQTILLYNVSRLKHVFDMPKKTISIQFQNVFFWTLSEN